MFSSTDIKIPILYDESFIWLKCLLLQSPQCAWMLLTLWLIQTAYVASVHDKKKGNIFCGFLWEISVAVKVIFNNNCSILFKKQLHYIRTGYSFSVKNYLKDRFTWLISGLMKNTNILPNVNDISEMYRVWDALKEKLN